MSTGGNIGPPRWAVTSTSPLSAVGDWFAYSSVAPSYAAYSTRAPHYEAPSYHARCPYCGTARKPFTYVNCINCGAPA